MLQDIPGIGHQINIGFVNQVFFVAGFSVNQG